MDKHENWLKISKKRQKTLLKQIGLLKNFDNVSYYSFNAQELNKFLAPIIEELEFVVKYLKRIKK